MYVLFDASKNTSKRAPSSDKCNAWWLIKVQPTAEEIHKNNKIIKGAISIRCETRPFDLQQVQPLPYW